MKTKYAAAPIALLAAGIALAPAAQADTWITVPGAWIETPAFLPQPTNWDDKHDNPKIGQHWTGLAGVTPIVLDYHRNPVLSVDYNLATGADELDRQVRAAYAADPDGVIVVTSLSQGTGVAQELQRRYANDPTAPPADKLRFVEMGSPFRGIGSLVPEGITVPGVDWTAQRPPASPYHVDDVIGEYDGWRDVPKNLLNPLAVANAIMGTDTVHSPSALRDKEGARNLGTKTNSAGGTTTTWLTPTKDLPLTKPLRDTEKFLTGKTTNTDGLDRVLRPMIDDAYDRDGNGLSDGLDKHNAAVKRFTEGNRKGIETTKKQVKAEVKKLKAAIKKATTPKKQSSQPKQASNQTD